MDDAVKLACVLQIVVACYELVVWNVDLRPYTIHSYESMDLKSHIFISLVNGGSHLFGAYAFSRGRSNMMTIYVAYLGLFTCMQTYFWWLPYLFGIISAQRLREFTVKLSTAVKILPAIGDRLVPSLEHTILFPLSVITLITTAYAYVRCPTVTRTHAWVLLGVKVVGVAAFFGIYVQKNALEPGLVISLLCTVLVSAVIEVMVATTKPPKHKVM